jgi:predicted site-specific integrase-resolvase
MSPPVHSEHPADPPADDAPLMTARAAAAALGVHRTTITKYVNRGVLRYRRDPVSKRLGVVAADVERVRAAQVRIPA